MDLKDVLEVAEQLHRERGGEVGLWPIFQIVRWTDERMGLEAVKREQEIRHLVDYAEDETNSPGERTMDALSFDAVSGRLTRIIIAAEILVAEARNRISRLSLDAM